jgi:hypothetical protein
VTGATAALESREETLTMSIRQVMPQCSNIVATTLLQPFFQLAGRYIIEGSCPYWCPRALHCHDGEIGSCG